MFNLFRKSATKELNPTELAALIADNAALLVDVRECDEFASGHIAGAINMPLSQFQATHLPAACDKLIVLNCAAGRRSAMALEKAAAARPDVCTHLAGGIGAWRAANYPLARA